MDSIENLTTNELWLIGILITILLTSIGFVIAHIYRKNDKKQKQRAGFRIYGKLSNKLTPKDVMQDRAHEMYNYRDAVYLKREHDNEIAKQIKNGQNVLVVGMPLAGKTRSVYEALKKCCLPVYIPKVLDNFRYEEVDIPSHKGTQRQSILFLDDINKLMSKQNFEDFLQRNIMNPNIIIVATCREGFDRKPLDDKIDKRKFRDISVREVTIDDAKRVAKDAKLKDLSGFEKAIGTIFMGPQGIIERYKECTDNERGILHALKRLYVGGIYKGKEEFDILNVKQVAFELEDVSMHDNEWKKTFKHLAERGFFIFKDETIQVSDVYLEQAIPENFNNLSNLDELSKLFWDDRNTLFKLANQTDEIGKYVLEKESFLILVIKALSRSLKLTNSKDDSERWAGQQNNLGNAYLGLASIRETEQNLNNTIKAFQKALEIFKPDKFPNDYAMTQNNLGNAYGGLAVIRDTEQNLNKAKEAYQKALDIRTKDKFPIKYAMTQNNLGTAYNDLSAIRDTEQNLDKAIGAYHKALEIRIPNKFPNDYAITQNNLGNAYNDLAAIRETEQNLDKAIESFQKTLEIWRSDNFPYYCAKTQNNLANSYGNLAAIRETEQNLDKAIETYQKALEIYKPGNFPIDYAMLQNNLGNTYRDLAAIRETEQNLDKAIIAFQEALDITTKDKFPNDYAKTQNNLGSAYVDLAAISETEQNLDKAIDAFRKALELRTQEKFPNDYAATQNNLGTAFFSLAKMKDIHENCKKANYCYLEAKRLWKTENIQTYLEIVNDNLAILNEYMDEVNDSDGNESPTTE